MNTSEIKTAPALSASERRKMNEAADRADKEAVKAALLRVIKNPSAHPGDIVRAAELLHSLFFRDNRWRGGDT